MVLERLYSVDYLERKNLPSFLLGFGYALTGIVAAALLFPEDPALVAVAFCALLTLPTLYKAFMLREQAEAKVVGFSFRRLWSDNADMTKIYLFYFLGVFLAFAFCSLILPNLAANILFREQLGVMTGAGTSGAATFSMPLFQDILTNNLMILFFCFFIALIFGDGAIFLIIWNASVWGTIFGTLARTAAHNTGKNPWIYFILVFISVFPHMILEALSYIIAAVSGGTISTGVLQEFAEKFNTLRLKNVILYNLILLVIAVLILVIAMLVETYVLGNFETYRIIINQSFR